MLRRVQGLKMKRTGGYVFWRQSTLSDVENTKKNYLLQERPFPIAEITRRMVRTRQRYAATDDFHEKSLLRGEYKFFSGKVCDLRGAATTDLISFLECGSFFGFWDTQQVERVLDELRLQITELQPHELVHLLILQPGLRKHASAFYKEVAEALVDHVDSISDDECVTLLEACRVEDPPRLVVTLLQAIQTAPLSPRQCLSVLGALSVLPQDDSEPFAELQERAVEAVLSNLAEFSAADIASTADALHSLRGSSLPPATAKRLQSEFATHIGTCDPHSLAMMFYACGSVPFALDAEDRVLFFASDFEPLELFAVISWYLEALAALGIAATSPLPSEAAGALQRRAPIVSVLNELMEVLLTHLCSGDGYFAPPTVVAMLEVMGESADYSAGVPLFNQVAQQLSARCIKIMDDLPWVSLVQLLCAANALRHRVLDAMVTSAAKALLARVSLMSAAEASRTEQSVAQLLGLRPAQRELIERHLLPALRRAARGSFAA